MLLFLKKRKMGKKNKNMNEREKRKTEKNNILIVKRIISNKLK